MKILKDKYIVIISVLLILFTPLGSSVLAQTMNSSIPINNGPVSLPSPPAKLGVCESPFGKKICVARSGDIDLEKRNCNIDDDCINAVIPPADPIPDFPPPKILTCNELNQCVEFGDGIRGCGNNQDCEGYKLNINTKNSYSALSEAPVINTIIPSEIPVNRPTTTITIVGDNFTAESVPIVNGKPLPINMEASTEKALSVDVPKSIIENDGNYTVKVLKPGLKDATGFSNPKTITVGKPKTEASVSTEATNEFSVGSSGVALQWLNIRADHSIEATILGKLPVGVEATITGGPIVDDDYSWLQIKTDAITGWIAQKTSTISTNGVAGENQTFFTATKARNESEKPKPAPKPAPKPFFCQSPEVNGICKKTTMDCSNGVVPGPGHVGSPYADSKPARPFDDCRQLGLPVCCNPVEKGYCNLKTKKCDPNFSQNDENVNNSLVPCVIDSKALDICKEFIQPVDIAYTGRCDGDGVCLENDESVSGKPNNCYKLENNVSFCFGDDKNYQEKSGRCSGKTCVPGRTSGMPCVVRSDKDGSVIFDNCNSLPEPKEIPIEHFGVCNKQNQCVDVDVKKVEDFNCVQLKNGISSCPILADYLGKCDGNKCSKTGKGIDCIKLKNGADNCNQFSSWPPPNYVDDSGDDGVAPPPASKEECKGYKAILTKDANCVKDVATCSKNLGIPTSLYTCSGPAKTCCLTDHRVEPIKNNKPAILRAVEAISHSILNPINFLKMFGF